MITIATPVIFPDACLLATRAENSKTLQLSSTILKCNRQNAKIRPGEKIALLIKKKLYGGQAFTSSNCTLSAMQALAENLKNKKKFIMDGKREL